jgi:hypothetical protein
LGNFLLLTSFLYLIIAVFICFVIFANLLTNLTFIGFNPIRSSVTRTWPSQLTDAPIPIVGIFIVFVISFASELSTHSNTIEKTPNSSKILASCKRFFLSAIFFL